MDTKESLSKVMAEIRVLLAEMRGEIGEIKSMLKVTLGLIFGLYAGIILLFITQIFGG